MIGVLAQADIADDEQVGDRALHRTDGLLHDPLVVVGFGAGAVLRRGNAKEDDAAQSQRGGPLRILHELIDGELRDAGQGCDGAPQPFTVRNEQRPDELRRRDVGFLHEAAEGGGPAQPSHAANRKLGGRGAHRASKLAAPSPSSKRATASPAASGRVASTSAEAVSWTAPSVSVTRPYKRIPLPASRIPTQAATGA